jgi:hypothetical protein
MIGEWPHAYPGACCEVWHGAGACPCACHQPAPSAADPYSQRLALEITAAQLDHAAQLFATVAAQIPTGDSTQAQLRARRRALQDAALAYAQAHGWQPPPN